ncbi:MAG TPA: prepilin-type N-terminal cleavage/methylation domain-containing protein [Gemmatimonadaceae bacterium]|nr:prepilin-type N-terminal cleavage/methylation domain-containing protein [Gemmatimonadaceae bacterium]
MTRRYRTRRPAPRKREGMTIIEVIVAMMILTFGLLGMAGFSLTVTKQFKASTKQEAAALMVQSRIDSLASIRCQALAPSGPQTGTLVNLGVTENWVIADGNDIKILTDTVTFSPRTRPLVYRSIIPCRD